MKKYNPNIHHRKSIRLKGYDYSKPGLYFITICLKNRACLYGDVVNGEMKLNHAGYMIENQWLLLPKRFTNIKLHNFIIMPNHFHAILEIIPVGATLVVAPDESKPVVAPDESKPVVAPDESKPVVAPDESKPVVAPDESKPVVAPTGKTVGDMVGAFQSITTVEYIRGVKNKKLETI